MRKISFAAAALAAVLCSTRCVAIPTDNWTTYQGNISRNGYAARALRVDLVAPAWNLSIAQTTVVGLAIYKGMLFTSSGSSATGASPFDAQLTARSLSDGQVLWNVDLGTADSYTRIHVDGDTVYFATFNPNTVYAYATDGTLRWSKSFTGSSAGNDQGPLAVNGAVYFFDGTNAHAYAAADGSIAWEKPLPSVSAEGGAPTWWNGTLLRHADNHLDLIDAGSGQPIISLGDGSLSALHPNTASVFGNYAYTYDNGSLMAFDLTNAAPLWGTAVGNATPPVMDGREVVAGGLSVRDPSTGAQLWSTVATYGAGVFANLVLTDTHVIAQRANTLSFVNRQTHVSDLDLTLVNNVGVTPVAYGADTLVIAEFAGGTGYLNAFSVPTDDIFAGPFE